MVHLVNKADSRNTAAVRSFVAGLLLFLVSGFTAAQDSMQFPGGCESVECEIWFLSEESNTLTGVSSSAGPVLFDFEQYGPDDGVTEFWLLDSASRMSGRESDRFVIAVTKLIANIQSNARGLSIRQVGEDFSYDVGGRPEPVPLAKVLKEIGKFPRPSKFGDEELDATLNEMFGEFNKLRAANGGAGNRGVFFWVTSRVLSEDIVSSIANTFAAGARDSSRLILIGYRDVDSKKDEELPISLAPGLFERVPGYELSIAPEIETLEEYSDAVAAMLMNGGRLRLSADTSNCGLQDLTFYDDLGGADFRTVDLGICARVWTACEQNAQSDQCMREQYDTCLINPAGGNCQEVVLNYCDANANADGCFTRMLNYCKANRNDTRYDCNSRVLNYCKRNPRDKGAGCDVVLIDECRSNPGASGCARRLAEDYCGYSTNSSQCDSYVTNYCFSSPSTPECQKPLRESCWNNKTEPGCQERLFNACLEVPTLVGCNDILLEQCRADSSQPVCATVLLEHCDMNPEAEGCVDRLTQQCIADPTPSRCDTLLTDYCWSNQGDALCTERLVSVCEAEPTDPACGPILLDHCQLNPQTEGCGGIVGDGWAGMHCEAMPEHQVCVQRDERRMQALIIAGIVLLLIIIALIVRAQLRKVPKSVGSAFPLCSVTWFQRFA